MKTLKMVFGMSAGANITYSLADPKDSLAATDVKSVMQTMIDDEAVVNGDATATSIEDAYIYEADRIELE